jgi:hypothetical protein
MEGNDERSRVSARPSGAPPAASVSTTPWSRLRVWTYHAGNGRELCSLFALSALSTWKRGEPPASTSFVSGAKLLSDPDGVDWEGFPEEEALEAEVRAPLPPAMKSKRGLPARRLTRDQVSVLREIAESSDGVPRHRVHSLRVNALLDRGLIEVVSVDGPTLLRASAAGKELLRWADPPPTKARRG